jgi:hypothetical protein
MIPAHHSSASLPDSRPREEPDMPLMGYPAPCPGRPVTAVGLRELAGLLVELGNLRDKLEASPAGLLGHFRRWGLARQLAELERRVGELRARWADLPPESDSPCHGHWHGVWRGVAHADQNTSSYGAVRAGAGGGSLAGCMISPPHERLSQT